MGADGGGGIEAGRSTRVPGAQLDDIFSQLPNHQLSVTLGYNTLRELEQLLRDSWSDAAKEGCVGDGSYN